MTKLIKTAALFSMLFSVPVTFGMEIFLGIASQKLSNWLANGQMTRITFSDDEYQKLNDDLTISISFETFCHLRSLAGNNSRNFSRQRKDLLVSALLQKNVHYLRAFFLAKERYQLSGDTDDIMLNLFCDASIFTISQRQLSALIGGVPFKIKGTPSNPVCEFQGEEICIVRGPLAQEIQRLYAMTN